MNATLLRRNTIRTFGKDTIPLLFAHGFGYDQNRWRLRTPAFENYYPISPFTHIGNGQIITQTAIDNYLVQLFSNCTLKILKVIEHCLHRSAPEKAIAAINAYLENERLN